MDSIKNIVSGVIGKMSSTSGTSTQDIQGAWEKVAGSDGSRVADFKEGCLTIYADTSMRVMKFHLNSQSLLQKLSKEIPSIKKIFFKVGPV